MKEKSFDDMMAELDGMMAEPQLEPQPEVEVTTTPVATATSQIPTGELQVVSAELPAKLAELPESVEDIRKELNNSMVQLISSPQVASMVKAVNLENSFEVVPMIGGDVMKEIDRVSGSMLENIEKVPLENGDRLIKNLEKIIDKVDIDQIYKDAQQVQNPSFFTKLSNKLAKSGVEGILNKYNTLTSAFGVIESEYARIIVDLQKSTQTLMAQLKMSKEYYTQIDVYIALLYALKEKVSLEVIPSLYERLSQTGDKLVEQDINHYFLTLQLIDQRLMDLQTNQQIILQTVPMIQNSIMTNHQLGLGFRTALDSVPILKSNIVTALEMKRSIIAGETLQKSAELRNKQLANMGTASLKQAELATKALSGSTVSIDTLRKVTQDVSNAQRNLTQGIKDSFTARENARGEISEMRASIISDSRQHSKELLEIANNQRLKLQ